MCKCGPKAGHLLTRSSDILVNINVPIFRDLMTYDLDIEIEHMRVDLCSLVMIIWSFHRDEYE